LLYLDDLQVGQSFTTRTHALDEGQIHAFATQFDPQPFHLDGEAAKKTLFGGLAASGWHTAAISMKLLVTSGIPLAGGIIGSGGELSWPRPTRPGDVLRVVTTVEEIVPSRSRPDRGRARLRNETLNQHDEAVQVFTANVVMPRRTEAADPG
jgi:acyl dehydratase